MLWHRQISRNFCSHSLWNYSFPSTKYRNHSCSDKRNRSSLEPPRKFPLVEYITATEMLYKSLEKTGEPDAIEKAQPVRNLLLSHSWKGFKMTIKNNIFFEERQILKKLKDDKSIIIWWIKERPSLSKTLAHIFIRCNKN